MNGFETCSLYYMMSMNVGWRTPLRQVKVIDAQGGVELATTHSRLHDKTLTIPKLNVGLYKLHFSPEGKAIPTNVPPFAVTLALCK